MNTALLVIYVQRGLCEGEYAALEARPLVSRINALAKKARAAQVPVLWIHHGAPCPGPGLSGGDGVKRTFDAGQRRADRRTNHSPPQR
jgi:nicotinamidase-related amidase